ncbi:hypothetical protein B0H14DRAFT_3776973 [Mycena olivaceomarginata]|nr:hypothetical protein B0H14DRAFT_3776973 [Mycena olivaceomarginata]
MQFKFVWLSLVILVDVSSIYGSAPGTVQARNLAVARDLTSREVQCNWLDCLTALAAEGVACAAAALEGGSNPIADISCALDSFALAQQVPVCLVCLGFPPPPPLPPVKPPGSPPPPVTSPTSPQCCSSVVEADSNDASAVASLLGLDLTGMIGVPIGLSCSPITVVGDNCDSTTVTCDAPEEEWGGLIAINCIPITL